MAIKHHSNENFLDNNKLMFGTGEDLQIYHDGSNSLMSNNKGDLKIEQAKSNKDLILMADDGSGGTTAYLTLDGGAETIEVAKPLNIIGVTTSGDIELGHASDTTIARSAAGKVTIEGAPIQTTQICTTHHNMSLDSSSSTADFYFPINSLADGSSSSLYYTRVLPAYDGKIVKILFRGSNNMGSSCVINMSRRAHDGTSTSHQTSGFQATETFNGATKSTVIVPCGVGGSNASDWVFEEGDQLGFSLVKNTSSTSVDLVVTIVYEYTIS
tara:strand:+ start:124 stop:933 length:810 start_codon:yes stop_codon:yes gene_type:complete